MGTTQKTKLVLQGATMSLLFFWGRKQYGYGVKQPAWIFFHFSRLFFIGPPTEEYSFENSRFLSVFLMSAFQRSVEEPIRLLNARNTLLAVWLSMLWCKISESLSESFAHSARSCTTAPVPEETPLRRWKRRRLRAFEPRRVSASARGCW